MSHATVEEPRMVHTRIGMVSVVAAVADRIKELEDACKASQRIRSLELDASSCRAILNDNHCMRSVESTRDARDTLNRCNAEIGELRRTIDVVLSLVRSEAATP